MKNKIDISVLTEEPETLLNFMREMRKPVFHNSNVFFRDIQYSIRDFFEAEEGKSITIPEAERLAAEVIAAFMEQGVLRQVNVQSFVLNHTGYITPKEGTIGLLNVALDKLPLSAIPLPKGAMPAVSTAVAPVEIESVKQGDAETSPRAEVEKQGKPAPPPWLKK